jgi:hypothetical protein
MDAAVLRDPAHPREEPLRGVVRWCADLPKLPLRATVARAVPPRRTRTRRRTARSRPSRRRYRPRRRARCARGSVRRPAWRAWPPIESPRMSTRSTSRRAQSASTMARTSATSLRKVDRREVGSARPPRAALIPVGDHGVRLSRAAARSSASASWMSGSRPLLHDEQHAPRATSRRGGAPTGPCRGCRRIRESRCVAWSSCRLSSCVEGAPSQRACRCISIRFTWRSEAWPRAPPGHLSGHPSVSGSVDPGNTALARFFLPARRMLRRST